MSLTASRLEYAFAFDAAPWPSGGPLLALVSTPEFVDLTLARTVCGVTFLCEDSDTLAHARQRLDEGFLPERTREVSSARMAAEPSALTAAHPVGLWAAPQVATAADRMRLIGRALAPDATLAVLTATRLGAALSRLRRDPRAGEPAMPASDLLASLRSARWGAQDSLALGGVAGVWWAVWARAMAAARRPDLADRAERAHHVAVLDPMGASFVLLRARRLPEDR